MPLKTFLKATLALLVLVILFYLDLESEVAFGIFIALYLAYTLQTYYSYQRKLRLHQQTIVVLKKNSWIPVIIMWSIVAVMIFKGQSGPLLYVNAVLMIVMTTFAALFESTEAYLINSAGIHNIKTSKQITFNEITEVIQSEEMLAIHTRNKKDMLLIERQRLRYPHFNQAAELLEVFPKASHKPA